MKGLIFLDIRNRVASIWNYELLLNSWWNPLPVHPEISIRQSFYTTQHSHEGTLTEVRKPWSHPSLVMMLLPSCHKLYRYQIRRVQHCCQYMFSSKCNFFPAIAQLNLKTKTKSLKYSSRTPMCVCVEGGAGWGGDQIFKKCIVASLWSPFITQRFITFAV